MPNTQKTCIGSTFTPYR